MKIESFASNKKATTDRATGFCIHFHRTGRIDKKSFSLYGEQMRVTQNGAVFLFQMLSHTFMTLFSYNCVNCHGKSCHCHVLILKSPFDIWKIKRNIIVTESYCRAQYCTPLPRHFRQKYFVIRFPSFSIFLSSFVTFVASQKKKNDGENWLPSTNSFWILLSKSYAVDISEYIFVHFAYNFLLWIVRHAVGYFSIGIECECEEILQSIRLFFFRSGKSWCCLVPVYFFSVCHFETESNGARDLCTARLTFFAMCFDDDFDFWNRLSHDIESNLSICVCIRVISCMLAPRLCVHSPFVRSSSAIRYYFWHVIGHVFLRFDMSLFVYFEMQFLSLPP